MTKYDQILWCRKMFFVVLAFLIPAYPRETTLLSSALHCQCERFSVYIIFFLNTYGVSSFTPWSRSILWPVVKVNLFSCSIERLHNGVDKVCCSPTKCELLSLLLHTRGSWFMSHVGDIFRLFPLPSAAARSLQ